MKKLNINLIWSELSKPIYYLLQMLHLTSFLRYSPQVYRPPIFVKWLWFSGSYDRTCKIFETASGKELFSLEGHQNVVYSVAFNNPKGTMLASGRYNFSISTCNPTLRHNLVSIKLRKSGQFKRENASKHLQDIQVKLSRFNSVQIRNI